MYRQHHASYLEELHPALLLGLDALLNLGVRFDTNATEGGHVLLSVLCLGLRIGQLDDTQTSIS